MAPAQSTLYRSSSITKQSRMPSALLMAVVISIAFLAQAAAGDWSGRQENGSKAGRYVFNGHRCIAS
jgi:hypothetical protein